jgi:Predicted sulfurtransferase
MGTFAGALDPASRVLGNSGNLPRAVSIPRSIAKWRCSAPAVSAAKRPAPTCCRAVFAQVYHLKGGILKYLEGVPEAESRWRGECFVFDDRVALGLGLRERSRQSSSDE